jgi:hypothetical protein
VAVKKLKECAEHPGLRLYCTLSAGRRVRIKRGAEKGEHGYVYERLDNLITGMARYGIRLDRLPGNTMDFCRYEFVVLKREKKTRTTQSGVRKVE